MKSSEGFDKHNEIVNESYRPFLIHSTLYSIITDQILMLMPSDRNVILTMNEYELSEINPQHPNNPDSPTHIIIFCIRFIADDIFQPIGGLLIYKSEDQSAILAECVKAYINDLWKLSLYVVATVSPPLETFRGILSHLSGLKNCSTYSGIISYSVTPFKEIIHIYDIQFLLIKLQNLFKESDIRFEEESLHDKRVYRASWTDVSFVLNLSAEFKMISDYFSHDKEVSRRVHIFTDQIYSQLLDAESRGLLSSHAKGSVVLLNCIRTFLRFTEQNFVDVKAVNQLKYWDCLVDILKTMKFQKAVCSSCVNGKPCMHAKQVSARRKIDFPDPGSIADMEDDATGSNISRAKSKRKKKKTGNTKTSVDSNDTKAYNKVTQPVNSNKKIENKSRKTDKLLENVGNVSSKSQADKNCDIDSNNNSDDSQKAKPKKLKKKNKLKVENFDVVVDNPAAFLSDLLQPNGVNQINNTTFHRNSFNNPNHCEKSSYRNGDILTNSNLNSENSTKNYKPASVTTDTGQNTEIRDHDYALKSVYSNYNGVSPLASNSDYLVKNGCETTDIDKSGRNPLAVFIDEDVSLIYGLCKEETSSSPSNNVSETLVKDFEKISLKSRDGQVNSKCATGEISPNIFTNSVVLVNDIFSSKSDEETENSIKESCDKVPNILKLLSSIEKSPTDDSMASDFRENSVTYEMLCTVFGIEKLMKNLYERRMRVAKPDAFMVEHIDFLVTAIKEKNRISTARYYGHSYTLLNSELAFTTLQNNKGLYLVLKE